MDNLTINSLEESLYKNSKMVDNFKNISDSRLEYLLTLVNNFKSLNFSNDIKLNYYKTIQELKKPKYRVASLEYLKKYNLTFCSYEELFFFLINTLDPNCEIYKYYLQNYSSNIKNELEEKFGFYNRDFLTLEKKYTLTFLNNYVYGIKKDYSQILSLLAACELDFDINIERINELKILANTITSRDTSINQYESVNSCLYNTINNKNSLGLKNESEIILFIIFSIDPNFNLLQIYEDECNIKLVEQRSKQEVGLYYKYLIDIEKYLITTNKVNVTIDTWESNKRKNYTIV